VLVYIARRIVYVIPIVISVALVCFLLVHITPGDPLVAILPADASQELAAQLRVAYGFDRPLPVQFGLWLWKAVNGDLGHSIATGRPVLSEVMRAVGNTVTLAIAAASILAKSNAYDPRNCCAARICRGRWRAGVRVA
jgi:peptide/nickel transport system permease protein